MCESLHSCTQTKWQHPVDTYLNCKFDTGLSCIIHINRNNIIILDGQVLSLDSVQRKTVGDLVCIN